METRIAAKRKAPIGSYGILTQNQKRKVEISLPTFQENSTPSKRTEMSVVETELQKSTNYLDILPRVPLQMIYEYLPVEDIVNTYMASNRMHNVAADKGIWKGKVLIMKDYKMIGKYLSIIREFPQLQGIDIDMRFCFQKEIAEAIRCYLEDLRILKVKNMGFVFLNLILEKSKNLEIIDVGIGIYYDHFPDLLRVLQNCTKLKELHIIQLEAEPFSFYTLEYFTSWREEVTRILADSFPSLTNIYLPEFQSHLQLKNIVHILQEKKNQLVNLSFCLSSLADSEALDIISSCESLNLDLSISWDCLIFKLDKLKQLKSIKLSLYVYSYFSQLLVMLSGIPMPNVKVLKVFIFGCRIRGQFLEKLVMKFPMLQELEFAGDAFKDIDGQLSKLCNLTELRSLAFKNIYGELIKLCNLTELRSLKLGTLQNLEHCPSHHICQSAHP